jgi:HEAT repeat protein
MMRDRVVLTGKAPTAGDALGPLRPEVLNALREVARSDGERLVRASALIALGRAGGDEDARLLADTLVREKEPAEVREAAAVGLGLLPPIGDDETLERVRSYLIHILRNPESPTGRVRGMALCALGLRARTDARLRMELVGHVAEGRFDEGEEAAHLVFACGLAGDALVAPELIRAASRAKIGRAKLSDVQRAHAANALALVAGPAAVEPLAALLRSRRSGLETKRATALALGRVLRECELAEDAAARGARALRECFEKENDTILRGFAAVALGAARPPQAVPVLTEAIDHGGNASVKPYCALALGLAARTLGGDEGRRIGTFLRNELDKTNHMELGSALSLALGLAQAEDAEEHLLERIGRERLPAPVRGTAAQALGLVGTASPEAVAALREAAKTGTPGILEDAALGLGLLGQRGVGEELAAALPTVGSAYAQSRLMLALSYLANTETVSPLLKVLRDKRERPTAREFAAAALGLIGDPRDADALFALDAWFNLYATTRATNEVVRLY